MRILSLVMLLFISVNEGNGQDTTFSRRFHLGYDNLIFQSIEVTDTCFFISGVGRDPYPGSFFSIFYLDGVPKFDTIVKGTDELIRTWGKDLQVFGEDQWIVSGAGADSTGGYVIVVKWNSQGGILQITKLFNPEFPQEEFIATPAGLIKIEGMVYWPVNILTQLTSPPSNDILFAKLNPNLEIEWTKQLESTKDESCWSSARKGANLILGAWKTNMNTHGKNFNTQLYLLQIDTLNGSVTKSFLYPSIPTNQLLMGPADDLLVEEDGSVIVATRVGKEEVFGNHGYIFWDPLILKVNASLGSVAWERKMRTFKKYPINQFHKIVKSPAGDGYVAAGIAVVDTGRTGAILAKVSPEGDSLWMRQYLYVTTVGCYHAIYDLEPTPDGGYVMVGEARPYNAYDTLYPPPIQQGWILKVDEWGCLVPGCQLDVGVEEAPAPALLKVYPNPASGELYVHLPEAGQGGRFRLYDALGRQALAFAATQGEATYIVSLDGLAAGWYVLVYEEEGGEGRRWMGRVVVE